jgi:hypothetical protein
LVAGATATDRRRQGLVGEWNSSGEALQ